MNTKKVIFIIGLLVMVSGCGKEKIESSCSMNGYGSGECVFTNIGDGSGAVCGKVVVIYRNDEEKTAESQVLCSGNIEPSSSSEVKFFVPNIENVCYTRISGSWTDRCDLYWNENT